MKNRSHVVGAIAVMVVMMVFGYGFNTKLAAQDKAANQEQVKHGEYLVNLGGCNDCHSPKVMTERGPVPDPAGQSVRVVLELPKHPVEVPVVGA